MNTDQAWDHRERLTALQMARANAHRDAVDLIRSGTPESDATVRELDARTYAFDELIREHSLPLAEARRKAARSYRAPDPATRPAGEAMAWLVLNSMTLVRRHGLPIPAAFRPGSRRATNEEIADACAEVTRAADRAVAEEREIASIAARDVAA